MNQQSLIYAAFFLVAALNMTEPNCKSRDYDVFDLKMCFNSLG